MPPNKILDELKSLGIRGPRTIPDKRIRKETVAQAIEQKQEPEAVVETPVAVSRIKPILEQVSLMVSHTDMVVKAIESLQEIMLELNEEIKVIKVSLEGELEGLSEEDDEIL